MTHDVPAWHVFGLTLPHPVLDAVRAHAEAGYPAEVCGLILAPDGQTEADQVILISNRAEASSMAFRFDDAEYLQALQRAEAEGERVVATFHSHCDAGAYFSAADRTGVVAGTAAEAQLVLEVRGGRAGELAAYRFSADSGVFDEAHPAPSAFPNLELRGGPSPLPIPPVGGRLAGRRLGPEEAELLRPLAEGRRLRLDRRRARWVELFDRGLLSPLTGFQRPDEARAVIALGRTPRGISWRSPVTLVVPEAPEWSTGQVIELEGPDGAPLAMMVVAERRRDASGAQLGGPLFTYASSLAHVSDLRARWLSAGAERILAVPSFTARSSLEPEALSGFDAFLLGAKIKELPVPGATVLALEEQLDDPWLTAAMAQNQGATHIWLPPGQDRADVAASLQIAPVGEDEDPPS